VAAAFRETIVVTRPNRVTLVAAASVACVCVGWIGASFVVDVDLGTRMEPLALVAMLTLVFTALFAWWRWWRRDVEEVTVDAGSITIGPTTLSLASLRSAHVGGRGGSIDVRLVGDRRIGVSFPTLAAARPFLRAIGFDATQRAAVYRLPSPLMGSPWSGPGLVLAGLFVVPTPLCAISFVVIDVWPQLGAAFATLMPVLAWGLTAYVALHARRLTIGTDGLSWRWFGLGRFVSHAEITTSRTNVDTVVFANYVPVTVAHLAVQLRSGHVVTLPVARGTGPELALPAAEEVLRWLRLAWDVSAQAERDDPSFPVPTLQGDAAVWLAEARARFGAPTGAYRSAGNDREGLWRAIEDPQSPPARRAAAAAIVGASRQEGEPDRLEQVARSTANPALKTLLEAAAKGQEQEIVRAVRAVR
jgi:hypothetical protein